MVDSQQNVEKSKDADAEDFSVIAQRFLNIFRQLHIFTPERRQSFDDAILALPPEVRGNFSKLLGGSVLQEYVDELEKKTGNVSARDGVSFSHDAPQTAPVATPGSNVAVTVDRGTEQLLAKVLENSQKNAQAAAQAQMQFQAKLIETMKNIPLTSTSAPSFDNSKLEELVKSLIKSQLATNIPISSQSSNAGNAIDGSKLEDMVNSLVKSQLAANKDIQTMRSDSSAQAQPVDNERLESIISKVIKSQAELITDAAKAQAEQLSRAITAGLKESYTYSTQSIIETLKTMNRDSVDALRESFRLYASTQKPIMVSNYNVAGTAPTGMQSGQNYQIAENTPKEIVYDRAPEEFYYEKEPVKNEPRTSFGENHGLQNEKNSENPDILSRNQKKKKKKNKNKNNGDANLQSSFSPNMPYTPNSKDDIDDLSLPEDDDISLDAFNTDIDLSSSIDEVEISSPEDTNDWDWVESSSIADSETSVFEEDFTEENSVVIADADDEVDESYNEKEATSILERQTDIDASLPYETAEEEALAYDNEGDIYEYVENDSQGVEEYAEAEIEEAIETYSDDLPNATFEKTSNEQLAPNILSSDALLAALGPETEDDFEWDEEENIVENYENELVQNTDYNNTSLEIATYDGNKAFKEEDWEYVDDAETDEIASNETITLVPEEEWEYVEVSDDEDIEYEWEYVEEEEDSSVVKTEESEEEWEWVEESEADEDGEWEWEYEEVPEDEKTLVDQEPITFEEEYVEPEGEYTKKPSPISSEGVIEQESIFNFSPSVKTNEETTLIRSQEPEDTLTFEEEYTAENNFDATYSEGDTDEAVNYDFLAQDSNLQYLKEQPNETGSNSEDKILMTDSTSDVPYSSEPELEITEQWQEDSQIKETFEILDNNDINKENIIDFDSNAFEFDEDSSNSDEVINFEIEPLKAEGESIQDLEDYLNLEELDNNLISSEENYENFDLQIGENNNIVEDLETIDIDTIDGDNIKL